MQTWKIDSVHSEIGFKIKHLMVTTVKGKFSKFEGTIKTTDEDLTKSEINFSADVNSINTNNDMRDGHLKSPDFFDAAKFPTLSFKSTSISKKTDNDYLVTGDLTMHGVTKPVTFDAVFNGDSVNMNKNKVMGFEISGALSRKDFGLTWNAPIETGGVTVSDEVKMDINVECEEVK
jgi:polyisoprenoid-binding protein YceI